jgi:7,8-dihydropterin-6-yl-methyl-4-(beta-D-ribofuranosyl)aminobenzene 5'-phosphate synthase
MKLYTLIEDEKQKNSGFLAEHGLSLYFEHGGKRILFDTGASDAFVYNATLLGIDLNKVDVCVISHAHDDHIGGLESFLGINKHAKVYLKTAIQGDFYTKNFSKKERTGLDPSFFHKYADRLHFFDGSIEVAQGVTAASAMKYRRLPLYASLMLEKKGDLFVSDLLDHELYIAIKQEDGVVVLTGCAHHGLLNILNSAQEDFGPIKGVVGGFHLNGSGKHNHMKEPESEIVAIAKYLESNKIKKVFTGHCTGARPLEKLTLMSRAQKMSAGDILEI